MSVVSSRPGPVRYLLNAILTVVVFALVGPLVGGVIFFTGAFVHSGLWFGSGFMDFLVPMLNVLPIAYLFGGAGALAAGISIAILSWWILRPKALYLLAALIGAISSVPSVYAVSSLDRAMFRSNPIGFIVENGRDKIIVATIGAIAAIFCTWLTRRLRPSATARNI